MIAVDTNVLLRALVDDPEEPRQCAMARALVARENKVRVADIVFMETLWVLHKRYSAPRKEVARIARELLEHPRYQIEAQELLSEALVIFASSNVDYADAVALADARQAQCTLHTFDRKLAKLNGAMLVV
jgi:predicted nucleic-acid-binding protein